MNREILFRGKRIDNGEWVEGYVVVYPSGKMEVHKKCTQPPDILLVCETDPETVCQYTGWDDKNGNKIFEWDIVDCHKKRGAAFWMCKVAWNKEKARFDVITMGCAFPLFLEDSNSSIRVSSADYEVVGNIFDNPELIGGEDG